MYIVLRIWKIAKPLLKEKEVIGRRSNREIRSYQMREAGRLRTNIIGFTVY